MNLTHKITYLFLNLLKSLLSSITIRSRKRLAFHLASFMYHHLQLRKSLATKNIKKAFPGWSNSKVDFTIRRTYSFFSQNLIDFISVPKTWDGITIKVKGKKILNKAISKNKGVILISGHFGCWEILGKWVGEQVPLFTGVALRQKNRGANKFFQEQREISGARHIFRKEPIEKMYDVLKSKGILGLVSDQDAKRKGVFVKFFGYPASTPRGASLFHIQTAAPIVFGICVKRSSKYYMIKFFDVITSKKNIKHITQQYTRILEQCIRSHPEQYFWFHRRWKTKP